MALILDGEAIRALVLADGLAREATADDGTVHVLFRDGALVRSVLLADWPAEQVAQATRDAERQDAAVLRQAIRDRLAAMAGKRVDDLLVGELKTLLLYLVWREQGIDKELKVKPIAEWGK